MRQAFAEGPLVARLHHLGVISGHLEDAHVREMFGGRTLPHLQSLDLRHNALSAAGKAWLRAWWQGPPRGLVLD
ncbi:MAG: hypothetical protein H6733_16760 [Alphaproteobacteria bacterium]|nr:hypothetical protein [Alphaproteobacteria bacterium]